MDYIQVVAAILSWYKNFSFAFSDYDFCPAVFYLQCVYIS